MPTRSIDLTRHIASLDGLRGIAVFLVFLHHYYVRRPGDPVTVLSSLGWVGVDIFFVLSGFLITGILFDTLEIPHSMRLFFARRALRLFPIYFVMVGLALLLAKPLQMPLSWQDIPFFAYGANFCTLFGITPSFGPNLQFRHLWSLAVEEQFYLLWAPLVFLLVQRKRIMMACAAGIAMAIGLRAAGVFFLTPLAVYQGLFTRMDSLLCGALLAMALRGEHGDTWMNRTLLIRTFVAGVAIAAICFFLSRSLSNERPLTQWFGYVGNDLWSVALLGMTLRPGTLLHRWMKHPWLRFLGKYSYGFYLWHQIPAPLFKRMMERGSHLFHPLWLASTLSTTLLFLVCLGIAMISFHVVEEPFLRMKRHFSYGRKKPAEVAVPG